MIRSVFSESVRRRGGLLLAIAAAALAAFAHSAAGPTDVTVDVDRNVPPFGRSAAGTLPPSDGEWVISAEPSGLIGAMAKCDDEAFFVDLHAKLIHRVKLSEGRDTGHIGLTGDMRSRYPLGAAADCVAQKLYVVDNSGVSVLDFDGRLVNRFAGPLGFAPNSGAPVLDAPANALYVPGIWTPSRPTKWLDRNLEGMFEKDRLGYRLDLLSGETSPMFRPIERDCWTFSSHCLSVALDKVNGAGPVAWLVAQKSSTRIGLFDARYLLRRTLDVRSPMFRQDGRRIVRRVSVTRQMALQETNSLIRAVYSFDDIIAIVHSVNRTKNWQPGQALDFDVYMNLYSADGTGLVSDIPLPNLPVGRDDSGVYVLDYGPAGRTHVRSSPMTLMRFEISSLRWQ